MASSRKLLIPVDNSVHSERALKFYLNNVMRAGDHVTFFHSMEMPTVPAFALGAPGAYRVDEWKEAMSGEIKKVEKLKDKLQNIAQTHQDAPTMHFHACDISPTNIGENIVKYAKDNGIQVVVIGSRGQGKVRRTFLGSVSEYVLHHAHLPIVIVPPGPDHQ